MSQVSGWKHQFIETNQVRLHCVTQGEGELVVLVHSFLEFWYSWRHQVNALSRRFKVIVPDLRGCNDSEKPNTGYDLDTVSRDIVGIMDALGYSRAHIVGHAWGGTIAWHLAQTLPDRVKRLVILNGIPPHQLWRFLLGSVSQIRQSWLTLAMQVPTMPEWLIERTLPDFVQAFFQQQAVRKGAFSGDVMRLYQEALSKPGAIAAGVSYYRQLLHQINWFNKSQPIKPISAPTLILWGEDDSLLPLGCLDGVSQFVESSLHIERIPQCGHWTQQEVPLTVNRSLLRFLYQG